MGPIGNAQATSNHLHSHVYDIQNKYMEHAHTYIKRGRESERERQGNKEKHMKPTGDPSTILQDAKEALHKRRKCIGKP